MKRTLALTVVTALCAVSPFVAGAAMSSLQRPGADTPATSYDGAQAEYILRDYEGYVSVFASGADRKPLQVTGIEVAGLRRADQELLRGGITVGSQEQLLLLLEDLGYKSQALNAHNFSLLVLSNFDKSTWPPSCPMVGSLRVFLFCSPCSAPLTSSPFDCPLCWFLPVTRSARSPAGTPGT